MPHIIKPDILETTADEALNPASLACIDLLMQVLTDAKAGNVTSVAIVACGPSDFGANMAGTNAPAMNMGLDVLKAKIIAVVTQPAPQSPILRPRPVNGRRS
jgi:hypothetical protein